MSNATNFIAAGETSPQDWVERVISETPDGRWVRRRVVVGGGLGSRLEDHFDPAQSAGHFFTRKGMIMLQDQGTVERIDEEWMSQSGMLQHTANPSREELRQAADSLQSFLEEWEDAKWKGGDRWEFGGEDSCSEACLSWLDALNSRKELRW